MTKSLFSRHGISKVLISDNGRSAVSFQLHTTVHVTSMQPSLPASSINDQLLAHVCPNIRSEVIAIIIAHKNDSTMTGLTRKSIVVTMYLLSSVNT